MGNSTVLFALSETGRNTAREMHGEQSVHGPGAGSAVSIHADCPPAAARRRLADAGGAAGSLPPDGGDAAHSGSDRSGGQLGKFVPDLWAARQWENFPGRSADERGRFVRVCSRTRWIARAPSFRCSTRSIISPSRTRKSSPCFQTGPQHDRRWIKCRRPFIVTGGELTLEMLDLNYNATSKIYDAPYQLKANNGIYLIDDFGRQQCTPAEVLNRWIVPMERRVDYLKFNSGGKITVPFEAFLIFSTNLNPEQLGDEAFLRRIQYKMLLRSPDEHEFATIFQRFCESRSLPHHDGLDRALHRQALSQSAAAIPALPSARHAFARHRPDSFREAAVRVDRRSGGPGVRELLSGRNRRLDCRIRDPTLPPRKNTPIFGSRTEAFHASQRQLKQRRSVRPKSSSA